ncbi:hypothetical protein MHBO_002195 [Bonamia ostreae]|uniref:Uncharacterized protein n=1 Tax=Bonamia ostreae TaxID=126728 RepID=A0ABV2ALN3_9EUKA
MVDFMLSQKKADVLFETNVSIKSIINGEEKEETEKKLILTKSNIKFLSNDNATNTSVNLSDIVFISLSNKDDLQKDGEEICLKLIDKELVIKPSKAIPSLANYLYENIMEMMRD